MTQDSRETAVQWSVIEGDCREALLKVPAQSVQTCVTSPPYFGLRDYGHDGQIGLEPTPDEFVVAMVAAFREVRRVLRDDGTVWLNLGDSYNADGRKGRAHMGEGKNSGYSAWVNKTMAGTKPKDLLGIPWMVAFALRADGWYLRRDIIWHKPNPMPESIRDRPTTAHEYLFLLSKSPRYFYDADAIAEDTIGQNDHDVTGPGYAPPGQTPRAGSRKPGQRIAETHHYGAGNGGNTGLTAHIQRYHSDDPPLKRNKRSVWTVTTAPYAGAHFATFPPKLVEPCVLAGAREGDTVLDPFAGAGTTGLVALRHNRSFVGVELNPEYADLARNRIRDDAPLLNVGAEAA